MMLLGMAMTKARVGAGSRQGLTLMSWRPLLSSWDHFYIYLQNHKSKTVVMSGIVLNFSPHEFVYFKDGFPKYQITSFSCSSRQGSTISIDFQVLC